MFYDDVMKQIKNKDFAGEVAFSNISPPIPILKTYGDVCVKNVGESILVLFIDVEGKFHKILLPKTCQVHFTSFNAV